MKTEDMSSVPQLNHNNSINLVVQCRLQLPMSRQVKVTLRGKLQLHALLAVSHKNIYINQKKVCFFNLFI